jgi:MFS family permease
VKSGGSLSRRFTSVFFGWWIVLGGIGLQILTSGLINQAYGAYVVILKSQFGWSQTAFSIAFSIQQVESGVLGPLQGWLLDRFGPRFVARIGICVLAGGVMLFSQMNSLALFYVSFLVMSIGMSMAGFVTTTTTLINWFERKRGTALGIMQTGGAVGGLMVPIVAWSLVAFGWRSTAFASGQRTTACCRMVSNHPKQPNGHRRPEGQSVQLHRRAGSTSGRARHSVPGRSGSSRSATVWLSFW